MASREERLAANQREFREANERLHDLAGRLASDDIVVAFLCECADLECLGRIEISLNDYFAAHLASDHYVILPGHLRIEGEELVDDHGSYEVVTKAG